MTGGRRYVAGVGAVAAAALALSFVLPPAARRGAWLALAIALAVQGPLGWWLVRVIGTERFLAVWTTGIVARLVAVATFGLVIAPRLGLELGATLITLVAVLMACVILEALVR
jgi:hypothetical protein